MPYLPSFRVCCRWKQNNAYWQYLWWQKTEGQLRVLHSSRVSPLWKQFGGVIFIKEDWLLKYWCFIGLSIVEFSSLLNASRSSSFWAPSKSHSRQQEFFLEFHSVSDQPSEMFFPLKMRDKNSWTVGAKSTNLHNNGGSKIKYLL